MLHDYEFLKQIKFETKHLSLGQVITEYIQGQNLEYDPPYQRNQVWKDPKKIDLIYSILHGLPIGPMSLVKSKEDDDDNMHDVLDSKQRLTAIKSFINNDLKIAWKTEKKCTYKMLKESFKKDYNTFQTYQVQVVFFDPMDYDTQARIFEKINTSIPVSSDEKLYATAFNAKNFFHYIIDNYLKPLLELSNCEKNKRFLDIKWAQQVIYSALGPELKNEFSMDRIREIGKLSLKDHAEYLHSEIKNHSDNKDLVTRDFNTFLKKKNIDKKLKIIGEYANCIHDIFTYSGKIKQQIPTWSITYILLFCLTKHKENCFTPALLKDNKKEFKTYFSSYIKEARSQNINRSHTQADIFKKHNDILSNGFNSLSASGIDILPKKKNIAPIDKLIVELESDGHCEMCNCILDPSNRQIDHHKPVSKNSSTTHGLLCASCNKKKNNISLNQAEHIANVQRT